MTIAPSRTSSARSAWLFTFGAVPAVVVALTGCAGSTAGEPQAEPATAPAAVAAGPSSAAAKPTTTTPAPAPRTEEAARAVAQEEIDAYAAGDYGGAWDLWTADGQAAFSRSDYITLFRRCPQLAGGVPFEITAVRIEGDGATVRLKRLGFTFSYALLYENGRWRWQPDDDALATYRLGLDGAVAKRKNDGACG